MRLVIAMVMIAVVVFFSGQPASPGDVTVVQGGKSYSGWTNNWGGILIQNSRGKIIMRGRVNRMGGIEIIPVDTGESFVGQVNPMGYGLLISPQTGNSMRVEVER
ncbi:MAG: hypothetical protein WBV23_13775 [Desulfobaccales bacterium]